VSEAASGGGLRVIVVTPWTRRQIERQRDERVEYAAACRGIADRDRGDSDVQSVEATATLAEHEAAKLSAALTR
jgi:hypothetical protein